MPAAAEPPPASPGPTPPPARPPGGGRDALVTLPNLITLARLCAVPATIWLILQHRLDIAFGLFIGAGISDAIDGWLARVTNSRSALGALLDPVADKALLVSVYVTLAAVGVLPDWLAIMVVFRDLVIVGGVLVFWVLGHPPAIRPLLVSKLNTAMQIGLAALALLLAGFHLQADGLQTALVWIVAGTTLASGIAYVAAALRRGTGGIRW
ncbi:CDP-alcohol phosphatidyltransferase [Siccirubricoccus deserti]|uniref:CDP-alcohol phosphatidyltransferase family protein n=1 Tax=Siccirubricoccus deserti TaxID=2013562 RepID=UPI0019BB0DFF|nr:CDP-alcohol phosphatidyltransferase family protein [Siccirubricoccus deserti]GGC31724.1 CDP-alcohol phosphatidyltransferase [Siccirubricoccus deserti]